MSLADLTPTEMEILGSCVRVVAEGKLIAHDWEFQTLFGVEPNEIQAVAKLWPHVNEQDEIVVLAINNSLNNLLGLVDRTEFLAEVGVDYGTVKNAFAKWRGSNPANFFEGIA